MPRSETYKGTVELLFGGRFRLVTWEAHDLWNMMVVDKNDGSAEISSWEFEEDAIAEGRRWAMGKFNRRSLGAPVRMTVLRRLR